MSDAFAEEVARQPDQALAVLVELGYLTHIGRAHRRRPPMDRRWEFHDMPSTLHMSDHEVYAHTHPEDPA